MASRKMPTNADLLAELHAMNTRITALESWKIAEDAAKKAVADYKRAEQQDIKTTESSAWIGVLKQVGVILGILAALLYAYAQTKVLHG